MEPVRFGIIGAGQIARSVAWVFREDPALAAVAVADVDRAAAERLAAEVGAEVVVTDHRALLERADVDAVYIATPPFLHRPMVLDALAAGKHALCEKPFALSGAEVREVAAAAAARPQLKVGCCSCRFHEAATARRARQLVADGALGPIYRLWFEAVSAASSPEARPPGWRNDPAKNGGGIAYDWGVYDLDWMQYVMADTIRPLTVFASMGRYFSLNDERPTFQPDVDGWFAAEIRCENGLTIHWERRAAEHGPARHRVEIRGMKAGLDLCMTPAGPGDGLVRHAYVGTAPLASEPQPETPADWRNTLVFPIRDMAAAISQGRRPASPPERQRFIHAVLDSLYASARSGAAEPVENALEASR